MLKNIVLLFVCFLLFSCGSQSGKTFNADVVNINTLMVSAGGDTLLSGFNKLATGNGCYDSTHKVMLYITTMPVYCYLTRYHLGNNPDTPITTGIQYASSLNNKDSNAFQSLWSIGGWSSAANCQPKQVSFPIDTNLDKTYTGGINTWLVPEKAYQDIVSKIDSNYARNTDTLFKAGLTPLPAKSITGLSNWAIEDITGFCAQKLPKSYTNLFCAAGLTVKVTVKGSNNKDSTIDCYLVIDDDFATMRWKDSIVLSHKP